MGMGSSRPLPPDDSGLDLVPARGGGGADASVRSIHHVHSKDLKTFALDLLTTAFASALMYFITKKTIAQMDPTRNSKKTEEAARAVVSRLGSRGEGLALDSYEQIIIAEVTMPDEINVSFSSIGGLVSLKSQLIETVLVPLSHPELFSRKSPDGEWQPRKLVAPPRGVLFYGPPGTGKTMTAKAIARDSGATFINLRWSTVKNKWYGESQKLIRACFSLAHKLAPSIIFVDEAECFLGQRSSYGDHSETTQLKAEFMSLWDGLTTDSDVSGHVLVLCATNRPWDLDEAILRRMPRTFEFGLPDTEERQMILAVLLQDELMDESVQLADLSAMTDKYSGSDLKEWCRFAAMIPIREVLRSQRGRVTETTSSMFDLTATSPDDEELQPRPLCLDDFLVAMEHVKPSGTSAHDYKLKRMSVTGLS
ncbi:AAA+ ATPase domain-containing protein [Plasmodiophora brassicae]